MSSSPATLAAFIKRIAGVFLAFFSIFAIIGLIVGLNVRKDPDIVHKLILQHIIPIQRTGHLLSGDGYARGGNSKFIELDYFCGQHTLISWDIDLKRVSVNSGFYTGIFAEMDRDQNRVFRFPISSSQVLGILGGSTGAWGIKDLAKYTEKGESADSGELFAAVLAGLSGYSIGYGAAMIGIPACDSPGLLNSLRDPSSWDGKLDKDELKLALAAAAAQAKNIPDANLRKTNLAKLFAEAQNIQNPNQKISSASFFLASEIGGAGYQEVIRRKQARQRITDFLGRISGCVCIGIFVLVVLYFLWMKLGSILPDRNASDFDEEPAAMSNVPHDRDQAPVSSSLEASRSE